MSDVVEATPGSALDQLRARVKGAKASQRRNLRVPGLEPKVWVRVRPLDFEEQIAEQMRVAKEREELGTGERTAAEIAATNLIANANLLARATVEILTETEDGSKVSLHPDGSVVKFGKRLAELLDLPEDSTTADTVIALYPIEGHVVQSADWLQEWSGLGSYQGLEVDEGN